MVRLVNKNIMENIDNIKEGGSLRGKLIKIILTDHFLNNEVNIIVPCCTICNFAKNNLSYNDFMLWIEDLINFRNDKK